MSDPRRHNMDTDFPTILIAQGDTEIRVLLRDTLQEWGYLVLEAKDEADALDIVRIHSRHIHLMLAGDDVGGRALATKLQRYRPRMRVLFVTRNPKDGVSDLLAPDRAVARVQELVKPPRSAAVRACHG